MTQSAVEAAIGTLPAILSTAPAMFRTGRSRGSKGGVDRTGGRFGAGMISRVSVVTAGEALGHETWLDEIFVDQVAAALAAMQGGLKSRWTHPDMSSDGLGKLTSRIFNPEKSRDGRQLFADQHFLQIGHRSPDGDLAGYLMDLADEDPSAYGLSIVFYRDAEATEAFRLANLDSNGEFRSPDPSNVNNFEHIRLGSLEAADSVDEPAANPGGLFSRRQDIAREADAVAMFAFGFSSERPEVVSLGLDPDRVRGFAVRFMQTHGLELRRKVAAADDRSEVAKFVERFGDQGAIWFAEGLSFEDAGQRRIEQLRNDVIAAEARLEAQSRVTGATSPAGFCAAESYEGRGGGGGRGTRGGFAGKLRFPGEAP